MVHCLAESVSWNRPVHLERPRINPADQILNV